VSASPRARLATLGAFVAILLLVLAGAYLWLFEIDAIIGPPEETHDIGGGHVQLLPRRTASFLPWLRPVTLRFVDAQGETRWTARVGRPASWTGFFTMLADGQTVLVHDDRGHHAFDLADGRLLFDLPEGDPLDDLDGLVDVGDALILRTASTIRLIDRATGALRWERARASPRIDGSRTGAFGRGELEIDGLFFDRATGAQREPIAPLDVCRAADEVVWVDASRGLLRRRADGEPRVIVGLPLWEWVVCEPAVGDRLVVVARRAPVASRVEQPSWRAVASAAFGPVEPSTLGPAHREVVLVIELDDRVSSATAVVDAVGFGIDPREARVDCRLGLTVHLDIERGIATSRTEAPTGHPFPSWTPPIE
jgi:hypothetical protein